MAFPEFIGTTQPISSHSTWINHPDSLIISIKEKLKIKTFLLKKRTIEGFLAAPFASKLHPCILWFQSFVSESEVCDPLGPEEAAKKKQQ